MIKKINAVKNFNTGKKLRKPAMPSKCETTTWSTVAQRENRSAKKRLQLSSESDSTVRTNAGRLFHTREVATENAQSTKTDHLVWYSMV